VNSDMSVAPEIALLAIGVPTQSHATVRRIPTIGEMARALRAIAEAPALVRHLSAAAPGRVEVPGRAGVPAMPGVAAWAQVLSPGASGVFCDCDVMMVLSGELAEDAVTDEGALTSIRLQTGRIRVHGKSQVRQIRAASPTPAITMHIKIV
jgi:hypothetical protein